jgi:TolB-like protein/lipoprotein NlpI
LQIESPVPLRIGLHIGEIFFEDGKVFGDGVNVASRIQSLGQANTILFSKEIFDKIKNHPELKAISLGDFDFKNVDESIEVFALMNEGLIVPKREKMEGKLKKPSSKKKTIQRNYMIAASFFVLLIASWFLYVKYFKLKNVNVEKSIAVLPFVNMSSDTQQDYFAEGVMDEILNHLFKMGSLNVISRTSSMVYKDSKKTSKQIANELGVENLLEGSVQKNGDSIRIIVKLINGKTDAQLWSDSYDEGYKNVFAIQSDIAEKVASELKIKIDPSLKKRIEYVPTKNTDAYNLILQAADDIYVSKGTDHTRKRIEQAIALDSNFADAYAWLALYWLNQGGYNGDMEREEVIQRAQPLLQRALQLNPDLAITHVANLYLQLWYNWNFEAVGNEYQKILELNPSNTQFIISFSQYLDAVGRHKEALENSLSAFNKDKNISETWYMLAYDYYYNNKPDEADKTITTASYLFPSSDVFKAFYFIKVRLGRYRDAITFFEKSDSSLNSSLPPAILSYIAIAYSKLGQKAKTEKALKILNAKSEQSSVGSPSYNIALVCSAIGQNDEAIKWLQKAYNEHEVDMFWLNVDSLSLFKSLLNDIRFQELLNKVGFK